MSDSLALAKDITEVIIRFEEEVVSKSSDSIELVITGLNRFRVLLAKRGLIENGVGMKTTLHWYTRFAVAITEFLIEFDDTVDISKLEKLALLKHTLACIFAASGYRGMSHLVYLLSKDCGQGNRTLSPRKALLLVTVIGIDDATDSLVTFVLNQKVDILFPIVLGWLSQRAVLTEKGEKK